MSATTRTSDYSLQTRLLTAVSVLLTLFLGLTGVVLDRAFRSSVEAGVAQQLQVQLYVLLSAVEEDNGQLYLLEDLRNLLKLFNSIVKYFKDGTSFYVTLSL